MPIIANNVFSGLSDRIAFQAKQLEDAVTACLPVGGGLYFSRVTTGDDYQVENPLITPAYNMDNNLPNFSGVDKTILNSTFSSLIGGIDSHISTVGSPSGITSEDQFLTTSGLNVSKYYDDVYFAIKNTHLNAINVFGPQQQIARLATTASGVGSYSHIQALGTGSGKVSSNPPNYAGAQFEVITETVIGANDLQLDVKIKKEDGTATSRGVTVTNGTASGVGFDLGTSSDSYIDVTNIAFTGGNNGDSIVVVNKQERNIAL